MFVLCVRWFRHQILASATVVEFTVIQDGFRQFSGSVIPHLTTAATIDECGLHMTNASFQSSVWNDYELWCQPRCGCGQIKTDGKTETARKITRAMQGQPEDHVFRMMLRSHWPKLDALINEIIDSSSITIQAVDTVAVGQSSVSMILMVAGFIKSGGSFTLMPSQVWFGNYYLGQSQPSEVYYMMGSPTEPDAISVNITLYNLNVTGMNALLTRYYLLGGTDDATKINMTGTYQMAIDGLISSTIVEGNFSSSSIPRDSDDAVPGSYFSTVFEDYVYYPSANTGLLTVQIAIFNTMETPAELGNITTRLLWVNDTILHSYTTVLKDVSVECDAGEKIYYSIDYYVDDGLAAILNSNLDDTVPFLKTAGTAVWHIGGYSTFVRWKSLPLPLNNT
ncbi:hypothetical protein PROFUN_15244 [Planoprotostelium fungivorum]|uniref:Uncharacterized protein n=1 Tax=Planoprotostelium fungivorum TaxID=1890364 RepID=A0A2P6MXE8_9EUKA|nr:hypothetical protein PROFUN_15244 [Planoprotostelium fungivorum]